MTALLVVCGIVLVLIAGLVALALAAPSIADWAHREHWTTSLPDHELDAAARADIAATPTVRRHPHREEC